MAERIKVMTKSPLTVAKESKREYFMVTDEAEEKYICFNPKSFNDFVEGSQALVTITAGRTDKDTPRIELFKEGEEKPATKPYSKKPQQSEDNRDRSFALSYAKDIMVAYIGQGRFKDSKPETIATNTTLIATRLYGWLVSTDKIVEKIQEEIEK